MEAPFADGGRVSRTRGEDHQDAPGGQTVGQGPQELPRGLVRPVHVLDHEDHALALGDAQQHAAHGVQDPRAPRVRIHRRQRRVGGVERQEIAQERQGRAKVVAKPQDVGLEAAGGRRLLVPLADPACAAKQVAERVKGHGVAERHRVPFEPRSHVTARPAKLAQEARFPDARLADDGHDAALARARLLEALGEEAELGQATDEPARVARGDRGADQPVDLARRPGHGPGRNELEAARQERRSLRTHERHARGRAIGQLLEDLLDSTLRVGVDLDDIADSRDRKALGVKGQCHAWKTQVPAPGRDGSLDGERGIGGQARRIVERLESERGGDLAGADLVERPAEASDLVEHDLDRPAGIHGVGSRRVGRESGTEQRHAARLPPHAGGGLRLSGMVGGRGRAGRQPRDRCAARVERRRRGNVARAQPELLHAVAEGVAGNPQSGGGA